MKNKHIAVAFALAGMIPVVFAQTAQQVKTTQPLAQPAHGMPMVVGAPPASETPKEETRLKYRDGSKPLTIGEMSEMERKRLTEEFLIKHGYTSKEPPKPAAQVKAKAPPPPPHSLRVMAVYGPKQSPVMEGTLNGAFVQMKMGETVTNGLLRLTAMPSARGGGITLKVPERAREGCKGKMTAKGKCKPHPEMVIIVRGGESLEFSR